MFFIHNRLQNIGIICLIVTFVLYILNLVSENGFHTARLRLVIGLGMEHGKGEGGDGDERLKLDVHPEPYVHEPKGGRHTHTLIILHGTSQTGPDLAASLLDFKFQFLYSSTTSPENVAHSSEGTERDEENEEGYGTGGRLYTLTSLLPTTKFIFPTGSTKRTTVFGGKITHAWFNIHDFSDRTVGETEQIEGMRESGAYLQELISKENNILEERWSGRGGGERGSGRVAVLGFSQGAAMGMVMLLSGMVEGGSTLRGGLVFSSEAVVLKERAKIHEIIQAQEAPEISAFIGLSGWLPFRAQIDEVISNSTTPLSSPTPTSKSRRSIRGYMRSLLNIKLPKRVCSSQQPDLQIQRASEPEPTCHPPIFKMVKSLFRSPLRRSNALPLQHPSSHITYPKRESLRTEVRTYLRTLLSLDPDSVGGVREERRGVSEVFIGHGALDIKVKMEWVEQMISTLKRIGAMGTDGDKEERERLKSSSTFTPPPILLLTSPPISPLHSSSMSSPFNSNFKSSISSSATTPTSSSISPKSQIKEDDGIKDRDGNRDMDKNAGGNKNNGVETDTSFHLETQIYTDLAHWFDGEELADVVAFLGRIWGPGILPPP